MAFEKGNKLGEKGKLFDGALRRAIAQDSGARLRKAAEQLLSKAAEGEAWAINQLADRLDGKAQQSVSVTTSKVEEMSLADIAAEIASIGGGGAEAPVSSGQSSGLH